MKVRNTKHEVTSTASWSNVNSDFAPKYYVFKIAFPGPFGLFSHLQTLSSCLEDILTSSVIPCHQLLARKRRNITWYFGINELSYFTAHWKMLELSDEYNERRVSVSLLSHFFKLLFSRTALETWPEIACSAGEALQLEGKENGFPLTNLGEKGVSQGTCKCERSFTENHITIIISWGLTHLTSKFLV